MDHEGRPQAQKFERPLSPHLSVYRLEVNMVMSILHRLTGAVLYFGTLLLAWWLIAAARGPEYFDHVSNISSTWPGKAVLFGYTWALLHHMAGGIRHIVWDTGQGHQKSAIDRLSWAGFVFSAGLTAVIWIFAMKSRGMI